MRQILACIAALALGAITQSAAQTQPRVEITQAPRCGAGPDSQGNISGRVVGLAHPETYRVVIYSRTNKWYVQPYAAAPFTDIGTNGVWFNRIYLGYIYAVAVVGPKYQAAPTMLAPLQVGGDVIAVAQKQPSTPCAN